MIYQFAVLLYGVLTIVLAAFLGAYVGSPVAILLAVCSAGVTYVFQALQQEDFYVGPLMLLAILLTVSSIVTSAVTFIL